MENLIYYSVSIGKSKLQMSSFHSERINDILNETIFVQVHHLHDNNMVNAHHTQTIKL